MRRHTQKRSSMRGGGPGVGTQGVSTQRSVPAMSDVFHRRMTRYADNDYDDEVQERQNYVSDLDRKIALKLNNMKHDYRINDKKTQLSKKNVEERDKKERDRIRQGENVNPEVWLNTHPDDADSQEMGPTIDDWAITKPYFKSPDGERLYNALRKCFSNDQQWFLLLPDKDIEAIIEYEIKINPYFKHIKENIGTIPPGRMDYYKEIITEMVNSGDKQYSEYLNEFLKPVYKYDISLAQDDIYKVLRSNAGNILSNPSTMIGIIDKIFYNIRLFGLNKITDPYEVILDRTLKEIAKSGRMAEERSGIIEAHVNDTNFKKEIFKKIFMEILNTYNLAEAYKIFAIRSGIDTDILIEYFNTVPYVPYRYRDMAITSPNSNLDLTLQLLEGIHDIDSVTLSMTDNSGKSIKKPLRGYADSKLEPLYKKIKSKIALTSDEQKTFDKFIAIKNFALGKGAKPKTRKGINTLGKNVLVYAENAKYLTPEWKEKLAIKGGRKSRRRRL